MTAETRRRVLSLTGALPLGMYVVFHLYETAAARDGRAGLAGRLSGADGGVVAVALETALVLVPFGIHAALGMFSAMRERPPAPEGYRSAGLRAVQRATGMGLLLFLLFHLGHTWFQKLGGMDGAALYDHLRDSVGRPLYIAVYVVGVTCLAFHVALGLGAFAHTWGLVRTDPGRRAARAVGVLLGVAVWIFSIDTLSHFAAGRAVLGGGAPAAQVAGEGP